MNPVEKLKQKKFLEESLKNALELNEKVQEVEEEVENLHQQLDLRQNELRNLKANEDYKSPEDIRVLTYMLQEVDDIKSDLHDLVVEPKADDDNEEKGVKDRTACPICTVSAQYKQVFSCTVCEHWLCKDCQEKLSNYPNCRQSLRTCPLKRNRTLEMVFRD